MSVEGLNLEAAPPSGIVSARSSGDFLANPPGLIARLGFGFTSIVDNTKFQVYEVYLIFYYVQVMGLAGSLAGIAVGMAALADAVCDPLIGSYSDGLRSRVGRRHLPMYLAIIPTGIFLYLLFAPPQGLGQAALFLWLLACSIAARVAASFYTGPAAAIGAELSDRANVRAELGIWRQAVSSLNQLALTWLLFHFAFSSSTAFPRGQENPANYPKFALVVAGVVMLGALIGAAGTQRRMASFERERLLAPVRSFSLLGSLSAIWRALCDVANFRSLFLGLLFAGLMGSYFRALSLTLGTYFWQLSTKQTGEWLMSVQVATFVAALGARALVGRVEPRTLYVTGIGMLLGSYVLPPLAKLLGMMPAPGTASLLELLYAANMMGGAGMGLIMSCSLVLFAECADEYAWLKRESRTGMLLSLLPLGNKTASSLGKLLAGVALQWIALPVAQPTGANASPESLHHLGVATVGLTACAGFLALFFFLHYHLPRQRYAEIVKGLQSMRVATPRKET
jgi:Na+/melibiose symporter-like transporter